MKRNLTAATAELIPRSIQLQAQATFNEPRLMSQQGEGAKSRAGKTACVCSQSGAGAGIRLLT
jgi:hypothetical protein